MADQHHGLAAIVPAIGLLLANITILVGLTLRPAPAQRQLAVLVPPWDSPAQAAGLIAAAGGRMLDAGGLSNIIIATSTDPGFARALYRAGAWLVMNPIAVHGCRGIAPLQDQV